MSAAELAEYIDQWRRLHAELEAAYENLKIQKKRFGEMREFIIQGFRGLSIAQVELPDHYVLQVRSEIGAKAKKPVQIANELNELLISLSMKDGAKRSRTVETILNIAFSKNPETKLGMYLLPPQHSSRVVSFSELV